MKSTIKSFCLEKKVCEIISLFVFALSFFVQPTRMTSSERVNWVESITESSNRFFAWFIHKKTITHTNLEVFLSLLTLPMSTDELFRKHEFK
jgi:hypothetical protein